MLMGRGTWGLSSRPFALCQRNIFYLPRWIGRMRCLELRNIVGHMVRCRLGDSCPLGPIRLVGWTRRGDSLCWIPEWRQRDPWQMQDRIHKGHGRMCRGHSCRTYHHRYWSHRTCNGRTRRCMCPHGLLERIFGSLCIVCIQSQEHQLVDRDLGQTLVGRLNKGTKKVTPAHICIRLSQLPRMRHWHP